MDVYNANSWYCNLSVNRYESQKTRDKRKRMKGNGIEKARESETHAARVLRDSKK